MKKFLFHFCLLFLLFQINSLLTQKKTEKKLEKSIRAINLNKNKLKLKDSHEPFKSRYVTTAWITKYNFLEFSTYMAYVN